MRLRITLLIVSSTIASMLIFLYVISPFVWIGLLWFTVFIYLTLTEQQGKIKPLWFNIGFLCLALSGLEGYLWFDRTQNNPIRMFKEENYSTFHEVLGYAPTKNRSSMSEKYYEDELLYQVTYTINEQGLRISPPTLNDTDACVLFFGGSFTFGEGVQDDETMPYLVGLETGYMTHNFGFHGYGPHQMLAALQHGVVDETINCQPTIGIYQTLVYHVERAAGYTSWDKFGPRYVLDESGIVEFAGYFDDPLKAKIENQLSKSHTYNYFFANRHTVNEADIALYWGIVDMARQTFEAKYPGAEFHVIFWDAGANAPYILEGLQARNLRVHYISDILPFGPDHSSKYRLSPNKDEHPNPAAYQLMANYVVEYILNE